MPAHTVPISSNKTNFQAKRHSGLAIVFMLLCKNLCEYFDRQTIFGKTLVADNFIRMAKYTKLPVNMQDTVFFLYSAIFPF